MDKLKHILNMKNSYKLYDLSVYRIISRLFAIFLFFFTCTNLERIFKLFLYFLKGGGGVGTIC